MPTSDYRDAAGNRVPGTTTVVNTSLGWSKGGLLYWAWKQGRDGKDFRETKDAAAGIGTLAHEQCAAFVMGRPFTPLPADLTPEARRAVNTAVAAFTEWWTDAACEVTATEVALVSERHRFGGTPDWIALRGRAPNPRRLFLPDVKTSTGTYSDHVIQVAAYVHLWEENHPEQPMEGGAAILRFDKATGGFSHKWWPREALEAPWRAFMLLRELYDLKPSVEALAK